jgi:serine protease AprX
MTHSVSPFTSPGNSSWRTALMRAFACLVLATVVVPAGARAERGGHVARMAGDLATRAAASPQGTTDVILHGSPDDIYALATRHGLQVKKTLRSGAVVSLSAAQLAAVSTDPGVDALAADRPVHPTMAVTVEATGVDQVWRGIDRLGRYTGQGVGVAVIDSGVTEHSDLRGRIAVHVDFTDEQGRGRDFYGHGTHIAGIIAGSGSDNPFDKEQPFRGMAPGAHIINLRVLGPDGSGKTSDVLEAIDWAIEHRGQYNIRVLNVSLGHGVVEAAADDPLVQAVERASAAGIAVVCSAGNVGKDFTTGKTIIGAINSPGNAPSVITVGALNTHGTPQRSDDEVTSYSSRGPTYLDGLIKPDLVAPGNKIVSLEAKGSTLAKDHPEWHVSGQGNKSYISFSGTSQASAVVAGAAAVLLQANPKLTPVQLKFALQGTATAMPEAGLIAAGAGSLNVAAAVQMAVRGPAARNVTTTIGGEEVQATGIAYQNVYLSGPKPNTVLWGQGSIYGDKQVWGDTIRWGAGKVSSNILIWTHSVNSTVDGNILIWTVGGVSDTVNGNILIWTLGSEAVVNGNILIWTGNGAQTVEGNVLIWTGARDVNGNVLIWTDSTEADDDDGVLIWTH